MTGGIVGVAEADVELEDSVLVDDVVELVAETETDVVETETDVVETETDVVEIDADVVELPVDEPDELDGTNE
jgi:hypothetical protein